MKDKQKRQIVKMTIFITSIFVIFMSVTYAFINVTLTGTKRQVITAGDLSLVLQEDENNLTISNAFPMYDEVGMVQDAFTFRLVNNASFSMNYIVKLVDITTNTDKLSTSDVKYYLTKDGVGEPALLSTLSDGVVDSGTIPGNETIHYTLRLWIRDGVTDNSAIARKSLSYRIDIEALQPEFDENGCEILEEAEPNVPVLASGMIPVTYDEGQKRWVKADTSSTWYDYNNQMWANAVTVTETNRSTYMSASAGTPISMNDINTMWVWIPRYSYTIRDTYGVQLAGGNTPSQETPGAIDIKFISTDVKDSGSGTCTKCADNWATPEGFTFGDEELSGFWIGKFETTGTMTAACTDENCTTADLTIKPSVPSLTNQSVSSFFYASRSMQNSSNANKYGFDVTGSGTMDVHMGKNTEWGIVAMFSQSKYGKYGNPSYSGADKEVAINNCSNYITGIGGDTVSAEASTTSCTTNTYETAKGQAANTTGTIYGVYDMSGGATEYVMGNYNNTTGSSSFSNLPDSKYYDLYTSTTASAGYKSGDATYETNGWYLDNAHFVSSSSPWFSRGRYYSNTTSAGVFSSNNSSGYAITICGARLILKP